MIKKISLMVASLATNSQATEIPNAGNFFYMVAHDNGHAPGVNGYDVSLGNDIFDFGPGAEPQHIPNVAISASEHYLIMNSNKNSVWTNSPVYNETRSLPSYTAKNISKNDLPLETLTI